MDFRSTPDRIPRDCARIHQKKRSAMDDIPLSAFAGLVVSLLTPLVIAWQA